MWAREEFEESVDVLFVDEAGQMSLADVVAVSPSAKSLVLLGDPLQLDQPLQGRILPVSKCPRCSMCSERVKPCQRIAASSSRKPGDWRRRSAGSRRSSSMKIV
jgi:hypothetical protein